MNDTAIPGDPATAPFTSGASTIDRDADAFARDGAAEAAARALVAEQRRLIVAGAVVAAVLFGGFGVWSAIAPISGAVIVPGTVAVDTERKTVQHLEGGIVKDILVRPGMHVTRGQPLIVLEEVQADAAASSVRKQLDADLARMARLNAERAGESQFRLPPELAARSGDPELAVLIEPERKLFDTRRRTLLEQVALLRAENRQIVAEIASLQGQVDASDSGAATTAEQLRINEALVAANFISRARLLDLQGQHADRLARRDETRAQLAQARQRMTQNELKVSGLQQTYLREATDELRETERRVADLRERLRPIEDTLQRLAVVAPIDGEVVDLRVHTVGGVVAPREPLMDIVPAHAPLLVKGRLRVDDITHVAVGAEVDLQLTAYKRRTTPVVAGRLAYISADALTEQTPMGPQSYYDVRMTVEREALAAAGGLDISPGMPVEAYVKTRERTLLAYLLQPVTQSMGRAFREF